MLSLLIIERVTDEVGEDPLDLPPLYRSVDPEAIDALLASSAGDDGVRISFRYAGCRVIVDSESGVTVEADPESS